MIVGQSQTSAAGLCEPRVAPGLKVDRELGSLGSSSKLSNELIECCILPRVLGEVSLQSFSEQVFTEQEYHLVQECSALSVADAIKDILGLSSVLNSASDRMGSILLVLAKSPELLIDEDIPGKGEVLHALTLVHRHVRDGVGEGLVEPEVVPPFHRDQIAEPLMGDLVSNCVEYVLLPVASEVLVSLNVVVVVGDASHILHGTHGVVRTEDTVELVEGIGSVEDLFVKADGCLRDSEDIFLHLLCILGQRLAAVDAHGEVRQLLLALRALFDAVKRASNDAEKVGGELGSSLELVSLYPCSFEGGQDL